MKRSPSPRTVLAHLLPETSTQNLLLFYLAILNLQPRATKTSKQGRRPSQRSWRPWPSFSEDANQDMACVLRGRRPRCFSGPLYFVSQRMPTKVQFPSLSLSPFLLDSVRGDHHHSNPNISQPTHTHTVRTGGIISKTGEQPKTPQYP